MAARLYYTTLRLKGHLAEERPPITFLSSREGINLRGLLKTLTVIRRHPKIRVVVLLIQDFSAGWSQLEEIHEQLEQLHQAGKQTVVYLQSGGNKEYYLSAAAQTIYVPPPGTLDLVGLRAEVFFFKNLLQRMGVEPQLFSLGDYKSAAEIFMREEMSGPGRAMLESIFRELQDRLQARVASGRSVSLDTVREWIDQGPYTARQALEKGLIDGVLYEDEIEGRLKQEHPGIAALPASKLPVREGFVRRLLSFRRPQIAYIVAEGVIKTGESRSGRSRRPALGSDTLIEQLRDARRRKRVRAVVLRIDSPGGSALASDLIWREVRLTDEKKPVIATFGDVAASGGYYIATGARTILGRPSSLTGSIGVIQGKFNIRSLLDQWGIRVESLDFARRAGYQSATRPYSEDEAETVRSQMREFYEHLFLARVAEGRKMPLEQVREAAEGRVWTGAQAERLGLVDRLGGIVDAIDLAREAAGLPVHRAIRVIQYAKKRRLKDLLSFPGLQFGLPLRLGPDGILPED